MLPLDDPIRTIELTHCSFGETTPKCRCPNAPNSIFSKTNSKPLE